ncbi:hypothetical protein [Streptomyces kanamyceticus]|uniref:Uncharacterized protein n=1 Tax=Streptomyces kanamyceticus TaxID=1967 RepID=A0A5J6GU37_STRKN|nr:hypothetical protein [Streptomyces kanamyceticus]QEU96566.1 hypothetical protein CP970_41515 [Streptomyces kanamyceticus]
MDNMTDGTEGFAPDSLDSVDQVDALIDQLETQFDDSQLLTVGIVGTTQGCTAATKCTGSCPCAQ